jgi:thiaminase/transcriptional activator TenA
MRFSDQLRRAAGDAWEAPQHHPFVCGIGDRTLDVGRFQFYVRQDYLFLIDYGRVLALASARAPRLDLMQRFAELAHSTLSTEMELHRAYAAEWGISGADLEEELPGPVTRGYSDFLLRTAALGDFAELVAALLPCVWGYSVLGQQLAQSGLPAVPRYARWIEMYSAEEFASLADWCRRVCDEAASGATEEMRRRMESAFRASCRYELDFWEQAWHWDP